MTNQRADAPVLHVRGVSKTYGIQRVLNAVDLDVYPGEVHALLGENGAGKSSLMKVIAGSVSPDEGELYVNGRPVTNGDPVRARSAGIGIVYQETSLIPTLSAGENVVLGRWPRRVGLVHWSRLRAEARARLDRTGMGERHDATVEVMGMAERQLVEIAKALTGDIRLLLLDEPTSALSQPEAQRLFELIRTLTTSGVAVVYVSHRLAEVMELCDRVTVLRDGRRRETLDRGDISEERLTSLMAGGAREAQEPAESPAASTAATGPTERFALRTRGLARSPRLRSTDLDVRHGEVVAIFGLVGAGRTRLARCLFGLEPATAGEATVFGTRRRLRDPTDAVRAGIGYVGEDRATALVPELSITHNITLAALSHVSRGRVVRPSRERQLSQHYITELDIAARSPDQLVSTLSGGNQQKVVLARWLCSGVRLLILDDPTRGIDVGAKEEVFRLVRRLAADGVATLYLTSELWEARTLADRLLVMAGGSVVSEFSPHTNDEEIMAAAGGLHD